ncbi:MCE family protein [Kibdelosporangium phytohabitans]|uniref:ABC transporter substrate-binding protein n=1 Tax=Kibdelosporangium phytohabitans TaxID=860235 RepID=A0A0N9I967_9PSEU|nr:MlaD family protein [Kibdelosporangium phytohabitans]ALG15486.1 ABC transporter substrate-binding protein [Kibdelosporangium phytohabitans]MBE1464276.1 phospholipid/cholesterol/gamma-HCH transport system substrate-binding protein [Kibdelosporangium phytohabitans]
MLTRGVRLRIVAFVMIAVVAVTYAGARYAGLDRLFGASGYVVTVQLPDSGGIFTNAEVTYRGVTVGRVGELHLVDRGIDVELVLESEQSIPADTKAVVANRSAIGEQYVDLRPTRDAGPYLADGSVIPQDRTSIPPATDTMLSNLDGLVRSVPVDSLRTVVDELNTAFAATGKDLQLLLDSAGQFTTAATQHLPQTTSLLSTGRTVLERQQADAQKLIAFSSGLRKLSEQLKTSDPDIRKLIEVTPGVANDVVDILRRSGPDLGVVFANLLTTTTVTTSRTAAIEQFMVAYPVISAFTPSTAPDGTGHLGIMLNFFDPPPCVKGYEGTKQRTAGQTEPAPVNRGAYCAEPPNSPIGVRGSQNAPFAGVPKQVAPGGAPDPAPKLPGVLGLNRGGGGLQNIGQLLGLPR